MAEYCVLGALTLLQVLRSAQGRSLLAADLAKTRGPSRMTGDLPSGWMALSDGGARCCPIMLVGHDLVLEPQLLKEPKAALRTRVVQMMDFDHGFPPVSWVRPGREY
jgi:hypothetical protein